MPSVAIVDAGPLFATLDRSAEWHAPSVDVLERPDLLLVVPAMVVTEVCQLAGRWLGPRIESAFARQLGAFDVRPPHPNDWARIADLVDEYADWPLGAVDASVVALAERLDTDLVITLDRRHFSAVRPRHRESFILLPG